MVRRPRTWITDMGHYLDEGMLADMPLGGRVKTGHFVDSQNRPFLAGVETA